MAPWGEQRFGSDRLRRRNVLVRNLQISWSIVCECQRCSTILCPRIFKMTPQHALPTLHLAASQGQPVWQGREVHPASMIHRSMAPGDAPASQRRLTVPVESLRSRFPGSSVGPSGHRAAFIMAPGAPRGASLGGCLAVHRSCRRPGAQSCGVDAAWAQH